MIYEYALQHAAPNWIQISSSLGPLWLRWIFWAVYFAGTAYLFYSLKRKGPSKVLSAAAVILPAFALAAVYHANLNIPDEAFVNLTHPFNLFHHGRFSFSQKAMIDGTVEYLYYFLLTPFAWTQSSLITAAALLGFLVVLGHLGILNRFLKDSEDPLLKFMVLSAFAFYIPVHPEFANGFGNALVSLLYLMGVFLQWKGLESRVSWIALLLPLCRPDGILYSGALVLGALLRTESRKFFWRHSAAGLLGLGGYFLVTKGLYGHWIPTPMLFKTLSTGNAVDLKGLFRDLLNALLHYQRFFLFLGIVFSALFLKEKKFQLLLVQFLILILIRSYYTHSLSEAHYGSKVRYYIPFEMLLLLVPARAWYQEVLRPGSAMSKVPRKIFTSFFIIFAATTFVNVRFSSNARPRAEYLAKSGQMFSRYFPKTWTVANTELNTFGFFSDHDVVDLWGYTNREIAMSSEKSASGVKSKSDIISFQKPDVIYCWWYYSYLKWSPNFLVPLENPKKSKDYEYMLTTVNGGHLYDQIMPKDWVHNYDVYVLFADEPCSALFLVRKEHRENFKQRLESGAFRLTYEKELDLSKIEMLYGPISKNSEDTSFAGTPVS